MTSQQIISVVMSTLSIGISVAVLVATILMRK